MDNLDLAAQATEQLFRINRRQFKADIQFAEFMGLVQIPDDDGECWLWRGPAAGGGHGVFRLAPDETIAARHFIMLHVGRPRPKGKQGIPKLEIDLLCGTPLCVNPDHLEWRTHREIIKRATRTKANERLSASYP